jgi:hypothetical protein
VLVTARQNYWLDEAATLEHLGIDVPDATVINDGEIVQVLDGTACAATWSTAEWDESDATPAECQNQPILTTTTLTDLGIEGALEVSGAAVSTDGENWTIGAAAPGYQTWFAGRTFVSTGWNESGDTVMWRSADGLNWDAPTWVDASYQIVGAIDDTLVAHFDGDNGAGIATSTDGAQSWSQISAADIDGGDYVASAAAGDLGIVVVTGRFTGEDVSDFQLSVSSDGVNWQTTPVADIASISSGYPSFAFVDDDHVGVVLDGVTRDVDGTVSGLTLLGTPSR